MNLFIIGFSQNSYYLWSGTLRHSAVQLKKRRHLQWQISQITMAVVADFQGQSWIPLNIAQAEDNSWQLLARIGIVKSQFPLRNRDFQELQ